jgi:hypothetical protein
VRAPHLSTFPGQESRAGVWNQCLEWAVLSLELRLPGLLVVSVILVHLYPCLRASGFLFLAIPSQDLDAVRCSLLGRPNWIPHGLPC